MSLRKSCLSRKISRSYRESQKSSKETRPGGGSVVSVSTGSDLAAGDGAGSWAVMFPELLGEIIRRVETSEDRWPQRQNVVACACVCKKWRDITKEIVKSPPVGGRITFPSCLKQPGPRDSPHKCLIKRNKKTSTFYLHLALTPCSLSAVCEKDNDDSEMQSVTQVDFMTKLVLILVVSDLGLEVPIIFPQFLRISFTDKGKFLLAARRYRRGAHTEYIISLDADDLSQGSNAYVGKLSSDFLGTNFMIYDSQPPHSGAKPSSGRASRRFASKQISPQVPAGNFEVGQVSYKFNLLKSRGPRRMVCSLKCPSSVEIADDKDLDDLKMKPETAVSGYTILKNKSPRWHEHLQCWCLNFHGRVTVASVKNFQLVATVDQSQPGGKGDEETVLLQFGKVGDDTFTMDYRQPLSAFQAFAICLTSFGTKLACE
ncbi:hypothetical protein JRO89_XSUnG0085800 [Xanthoceras sorbifolium]|uniref:Tubby-like F-box protein n=1 Tax=Xanthoceras sorbifolium TaxID=99658 RepID=A0ABQ8GZJ3_9ROSI|nr:hypothetical protein JRO89_XSUnG0085800 [Xanthoceras sorbifolium]